MRKVCLFGVAFMLVGSMAAADTGTITIRLNTDQIGSAEQVKILRSVIDNYAEELAESDPKLYPDQEKVFKVRQKSYGRKPLIEVSGPEPDEMFKQFAQSVRKLNITTVKGKLESSQRRLEIIERRLALLEKKTINEDDSRRYEALLLEKFRTEAQMEKISSSVESIQRDLGPLEMQYRQKINRLTELYSQLGTDPAGDIQTARLIIFQAGQDLEKLESELVRPSDRLVQELEKELYLAEAVYLYEKEVYGEEYGPLQPLKKKRDWLGKILDREERQYLNLVRERIESKKSQIQSQRSSLGEFEQSQETYRWVLTEYNRTINAPPTSASIDELKRNVILLGAELDGLNSKIEFINEEMNAAPGDKNRLVELQQERDRTTAEIKTLETTRNNANRGAYEPEIVD